MMILVTVGVVVLAGGLGFLAGALWNNNKIVSGGVDAYTKKQAIELKNSDVKVVLKPVALHLNTEGTVLENENIKLTRKGE